MSISRLAILIWLILCPITQSDAAFASDAGDSSSTLTVGDSLKFLGPTLIDGTGAPAREVQALIVADGHIVQIVPQGQQVKCNGRRIDARGRYLIPGLWDMHVHLFFGRQPALSLLLVHGVTGVRDMGGDLDELFQWKQQVGSGELVGPRIVLAGPMLESPTQVENARKRGEPETSLRNHWPVANEDEARKIVRQLASRGVDFIKVRSVISAKVLRAIAQTAREEGLDVVGHPPWGILDPPEAAAAGMKSFEHGFYPWPPPEPDSEDRRLLIEALIKYGTALVPTFVAWEPRATPLELAERRVDDRLGLMDFRHRYLTPELLENWRDGLEDRRREGREGMEGWREVLDKNAAEIGALHKAGVRVLPGTDLAVPLVYPGAGLQEELALFVEKAGMTPMEAILSATRDATEFLHLGEKLGTLEVGKEADMVLLSSNPLEDIRYLATVRGVVIRGQYFDTQALDRLLDSVRKTVAIR